MLPGLRSVNARLDLVLAPPYPKTAEDRAIWMPAEAVAFPGPILPKWLPPEWMPSEPDGGLWLAPHVLCYQRGYQPQDLMQAYYTVAGTCFGKNAAREEEGLSMLAYDFVVFVVSHERRVVGGCVVEFRPPTPQSPDDTACMYIGTLCIGPNHGSRGLAHQLVRSVYTLSSAMIEQNRTAPGMWRDAISNQRICVALSVAKTPHCAKEANLVRLYSQCGLRRHRVNTAVYDSFTPYSVYEWQLEKASDTLIPMWQTVCPGMLYEDECVSILSPGAKGGISAYHAFPKQYAQSVRSHGLVRPKHMVLHKSQCYAPETISFQMTAPVRKDLGVFQLRVQTKLDVFVLQISIPAWFAERVACEAFITP